MLLNLVVIGGFVAGWGLIIVVVVNHERRLRTQESRWQKLEGLWKL